ncbi:glucokinase [Arcticibacter tournemirensis]|uniref:ROK family protein n=1 Tax=Arcticibacter tournemirensis TaxID=699437 RepID=A0A4Q0MAJ9_9SPHI|nr:ROK family protein [Arcticibacter tournemirensis]KAA8477206.1 ROK family protein [Arcticibacter tournemirensis]RXF70214.1 ROK family protein [Arcticibacter tournemirensis]TQM50205.1 glucokinase [Arcticibacter tournemirensis]
MNNSLVLGIDIGGSHITSALIDIVSGQVFRASYVRKFVNSHLPAEDIIPAWSEAIKASFAQAGLEVITKIGIAMPGPLDYEKGICWIKDQDKYEHLYGLNIKELLAKNLGIESTDIKILNDACGFLQGEVLGTLDSQYDSVMGFTLGTGLGSALYRDGEVTDADLWRMPFRDGIAEDYLSTRWFIRRYKELKGEDVKDVKHLLERLDQEPTVAEMFVEFGNTLGTFLNECINANHPEAIVLGGNISKSPELYLKHTEKVLAEAGNNVPITLAKLGEEAALIGGAGVWKKVLTGDKQLVNK